MSNALETYIKKELDRGVDEDDLMAVLKDEGWETDLIEESLEKTKSAAETPAPEMQKQTVSESLTTNQEPINTTQEPFIHSSPTQQTSTSKPQKAKRSKKWIIIGAVVALLLLLGVSGYVLNQKVVTTPDQVYSNMVSTMQGVNSFSFSGSAEIMLDEGVVYATDEIDLSDLVTPNLYQLVFSGAIDALDPAIPKFSILGDLDTKNVYFGKAELVTDGADYFVKVHDLGFLEIIGLSHLKGQWIKLDEGAITNTSELRNTQLKSAVGIAFNSGALTVVEQLADEQVDGYGTYHISYTINKEALKQAAIDIYKTDDGSEPTQDQLDAMDKFIENTEFDNGEVWIDKDKYYIRKFTFSMNSNDPDNLFSIKSEIKLNNFNQPNLVQIPFSYTTFEELQEKLMEDVLIEESLEKEATTEANFEETEQNLFGPLPLGF